MRASERVRGDVPSEVSELLVDALQSHLVCGVGIDGDMWEGRKVWRGWLASVVVVVCWWFVEERSCGRI